jgi:hypothetical protein
MGDRNRTAVLAISGAIVLVIAFADWWTKPFVAFGVLYLFPIMLAAGFLPRFAIALIGLGWAVLSEMFSSLPRQRCASPLRHSRLAVVDYSSRSWSATAG